MFGLGSEGRGKFFFSFGKKLGTNYDGLVVTSFVHFTFLSTCWVGERDGGNMNKTLAIWGEPNFKQIMK